MNCKPGDLAIVIRGRSGKNDGKIVRVIRPSSGNQSAGGWTWVHYPEDGPAWMCEGGDLYTGNGNLAGNIGFFRDSSLKPIRDPGDDAVDEMVQKLGKPEGVTA
jgi:hypothetical protein